jgi:hypothetical protein
VSPQECVDAHADSQVKAKQSELKSARERALVCANDACPSIVRSECLEMVDRLGPRIPSVVIAVIDARGDDLVAVSVDIDGERALEQLGGQGVDVDPGPHTFVFHVEGRAPIEKKVLLREGEKRRRIELRLTDDGAVTHVETQESPLGSASPSTDATPGPDADDGGETNLLPFVFGGIGVLGLASFAGFGAVGMSERSDLDACKPTCTDDEVDPVRTKLIIADVSLAVGLVSLGIATYLFLSDDDEAPAVDVGVVPTSSGGFVAARGVF